MPNFPPMNYNNRERTGSLTEDPDTSTAQPVLAGLTQLFQGIRANRVAQGQRTTPVGLSSILGAYQTYQQSQATQQQQQANNMLKQFYAQVEMERLGRERTSAGYSRQEESRKQQTFEERKLPKVEALRSDFEQSIKPFLDARDGHLQVEASFGDDTPASDIAMIFGFMKVVDPRSTVRESEAATAKNAAGVPERVRTLYNNLIKGDQLGPTQRADYLRQSRKLILEKQNKYKKDIDEFKRIAQKSNLDPDLIIRDVFLDDKKLKNEGKLMKDASGNMALVYDDGSFEEVRQ